MPFINYQESINQLNPLTRKVILILIDLFLFPISTLFVFGEGSNSYNIDSKDAPILILMSGILGTSIFFLWSV